MVTSNAADLDLTPVLSVSIWLQVGFRVMAYRHNHNGVHFMPCWEAASAVVAAGAGA
jgi:hypothetical protein